MRRFLSLKCLLLKFSIKLVFYYKINFLIYVHNVNFVLRKLVLNFGISKAFNKSFFM